MAEALAGKSANFCTDDPPPTTPVRGADGKTTTVAESFARSPLSTAKLVKGLVPGLGVVGVGRLSKKIKDRIPRPQIANTPSAVQLLGLFLALGRSEAGLKEFLTEDCECKPSDADRTVAALQAKAESICGMQAGVVRRAPLPARAARALSNPPEPRPLPRSSAAAHLAREQATPAAKRTAPRLAPTPEAGEAGEAEADDAGGAALDEAAVEKEVRSTRSVLGVLLLLGLLGAAAAVLARVGGYA